MPTSRQRHMVTESDQVAQALADAAKRWPEDRSRPGRLLARLVHEGHRSLRVEREQSSEHRRAAVARTSGALTGVYEAAYLTRLRDDWRE